MNPTLVWNTVPGAAYYKFYVYTSRRRLGTKFATVNVHLYCKSTYNATYSSEKSKVDADRGYLVVINSADEQTLMPNDYSYWIGLNDEATEGEFRWGTGYAPLAHTN